MKKIKLFFIGFAICLIIPNVIFADNIYVLPGNIGNYNYFYSNLEAAIIGMGHIVTKAPDGTITLPASLSSTCQDINGYDWVFLFGNINYTSLTGELQTYIGNGGKVFYQYEVTCCNVASTGFGILASAVTGLLISPSTSPYECFNAFSEGWKSTQPFDCCLTLEGNAYKVMDGVPINNSLEADSPCLNGTNLGGTNFGVVFRPEDLPNGTGALVGLGDLNLWYVDYAPGNALRQNALDFFFPISSSTCSILESGCSNNSSSSNSGFIR